MPRHTLPIRAAVLSFAFAVAAVAATPPPTCHVVQIVLPATAPHAVSGRLLLFAIPLPKANPPAAIDVDEFEPDAVTVAAQEIPRLTPGETTTIDTDRIAFPAGFSKLKPGSYLVQAVLDTHHDYAYGGRTEGDLVSDVTRFTVNAGAADIPPIALRQTIPAANPWVQPARVPAAIRQAVAASRPDAIPIQFQSACLTKFWGRPIVLRAWVLPPPGYDAKAATTYPTVYYTHGFGGSHAGLLRPLAYVDGAMRANKLPPMIWVFLDQSSPTGTSEFADSVNNGPWGDALTQELIPNLEAHYRMDGTPGGRFLTGHSSGGWATLWLQVTYPSFFGGTWSTSPDPTDFHDFTNVDLYAPHANMYHLADGAPVPLVRMHGKAVGFIEPVAKLEAVLGRNGGQFSSFDWVFSPRGPDGSPIPMFNRVTGDVDPDVVAYWQAHYDIAHLIAAHWRTLQPDLDGKIHVIVGGADTFYLDGPAHRLQSVLDGLHARSEFRFIPGRGHFDLYEKGKDMFGLMKDMVWEMYAQARPNSPLREPAGP
ncbi:MAG TPA: alpha/beta hydrolase-fold protein [Acetobacteraceae bacterium]|nr:alpha/beta hydrolase-fold protein [Acetobacteraceae bacterium]